MTSEEPGVSGADVPDLKVARHKGDKLEFGLVPASLPIFFYRFYLSVSGCYFLRKIHVANVNITD